MFMDSLFGLHAARSTRRSLLKRTSLGALWAGLAFSTLAPSALAFGGSAPASSAPPILQAVAFAPATLTGGSAATGTVRFNGMTDGAVVHLISSNPAVVQVPEQTVVSGGQSSGAFAITTSPLSDVTPVTITATSFGVTVSGTLTVTPGQPVAADVVQITRAEWNLGLFRIEATSTNPSAILSVYGPATGVLMFTLVNNGGGRYSIQRSWLDNPGGIVVRSNFGGVATASTLR